MLENENLAEIYRTLITKKSICGIASSAFSKDILMLISKLGTGRTEKCESSECKFDGLVHDDNKYEFEICDASDPTHIVHVMGYNYEAWYHEECAKYCDHCSTYNPHETVSPDEYYTCGSEYKNVCETCRRYFHPTLYEMDENRCKEWNSFET